MMRWNTDSGAWSPTSGIYFVVAGKDFPCDFVQEFADLHRDDCGEIPFWIQGKQVEPARANQQSSTHFM
jgi:hypothetical protein